MAKTFKRTKDGNIEVFENGNRITTTTVANAKLVHGFTEELTLPPTDEITRDSLTLPQSTGEPNPLLTFKDTLSKVTDLARNKRNATSLQFAAPFRGTVAASDFSSILSNLNRASERFTTEATERLLPEEKSLRFISATKTQPSGTFDPQTGIFTLTEPVGGTGTPTTDIFDDVGGATGNELKTQAKKVFGTDFANKIILDLTDEQLREFMRDYQATQNELRQTINPEQFFVEWIAETGIKTKSSSTRVAG